MRNPERIPEVLKELEKFWKQNPDWRLGQVISNFSYEIMGNNDPFYIEDKDLLELLRQKNKNKCRYRQFISGYGKNPHIL